MLAAPVGVLELVDKQADLGIARAAAALGIPYVLSTQGSISMERVAEAMGDSPRWFQLYWSSNDDLVASLVSRAEASGPRRSWSLSPHRGGDSRLGQRRDRGGRRGEDQAGHDADGDAGTLGA